MSQSKKISKTRAEKLWSELREGFVNQEKTITEIIRTRAWETLGYDSFAAAWTDRMSGIRLATDAVKAAVVYVMFDATQSPEAVADAIGGISPKTARNLKRQKDNGVPAEMASVRNWGYTRDPDPKTRPIIIGSIPVVLYEQYEKLAQAAGSSLQKEAEKAIHAHFQALQRGNEGRAA